MLMGYAFPNGESQFSAAALVLAMSFSHHHGDAIQIPVATCPGYVTSNSMHPYWLWKSRNVQTPAPLIWLMTTV